MRRPLIFANVRPSFYNLTSYSFHKEPEALVIGQVAEEI